MVRNQTNDEFKVGELEHDSLNIHECETEQLSDKSIMVVQNAKTASLGRNMLRK